ncbi:glycosyltransferase family 4 protein [Klebsiella michiganensis]|uniref:glycosyltransferase family 4 protein n=1 Tax=Klebsiella michiganensis TaxID=1134687 RepID=UPI000A3B5B76|nr:glycosyltransferase family 4 protein [Klebsiella michiganensis]ELI8802185.1 glycosyltransferase family 4 protein [Klebsiella michiganensis]MBE0155463.1 glycosyltransferase [Klebsiella michiganensis]MBE0169824.1 glycosyltransferase [Klebsiella michiganensis]MBE0189750.1 glycosyltransferase [Klebsiella michiganensis]MBE0217786.1 glycosyltransferase [Klebsiella michiganensis]
MKIMIFNALYYPYRVGGAEISVQLLAEELVRQGNKVCVVTLGESQLREKRFINGVDVISLPLKNVYWPYSEKKKSSFKKVFWHLLDVYNIFMYRQVSNEIRKYKPDIVHTNNLSGFSVCVWHAVKKLDIKLVHTSRDYYLFHPNSTLFKNDKNMPANCFEVMFWSFIKKKMSHRVDSYIGISNFISQLHLENGFFTNASCGVIYNAVDKIEIESSKNKKNRVGFLGRLTYEKGFDEYCSLARKYKDNIDYEFIAAGRFINNGTEKELSTLAHSAGVIVKGYMDLKEFLNSVDLVVLPIKWNEPFGRTIVECALADKIVITTNTGALPELSKIMDNIIISNNLFEGFAKGVSRRREPVDSKNYADIFKSEFIAEQYLSYYK